MPNKAMVTTAPQPAIYSAGSNRGRQQEKTSRQLDRRNFDVVQKPCVSGNYLSQKGQENDACRQSHNEAFSFEILAVCG
jgi:hypothetical protein